MNNHDGALSFDLLLNDRDFQRQLTQNEKRILGFTNKVTSETEKMDQAFNRVGRMAAAAFAGIQLSQLPGQIVKVRGEFQQLEIALNTMLGSKAKADKLMSEIIQTAATTPFGMKDLASGTKQLIAYGSAAETVMGEIRMLGDVASGVTQPIGDLIYLYGTLRTQGRAYAVDIRQFAGRGIPIYAELAKVLKINEDQVNAFVEAGKVGFKEVEQAFRNMTGVGGMFNNLMADQSKSIPGLIERLKDGIDVAFNEIGKANQGTIEEVIKGATAVVENYEKVIDVLKVVVATYGTYRAALMLTAAMQASTGIITNIKMWADLARSVNNAKDAQILFNLATKANPYVIAATALAALVAGFVVFGREASNAEKIQNSLNEAMRKAEDSAAAEQAKIQTLTTRIKNETSSRQDRNKALQELIQLSPEHLGALSLENIATEKGTEAINNYIEAKKKQLELKEIETQLEESIKRQNSAKNQDSDLSIFDKIGISLAASGSRGEVNYSKSVAAERKRLNDDLLKQEEEVQDKLRKRIETLTGVSDATKKTGTEADAVTRKTVSWYEEEISALKKKQEAQSEDREAYLKYQKQIDDLERKRDAITGGKQKKVPEKDKPQPYGSLAYWEQVSRKASEALEKLPGTDQAGMQKQQDIIIQAEQRIAEIRKSIVVKSFEEEIAEKQKQYELYERWVQHMGEDAAKAQFSGLLSNGASYADFLNAEIEKLTSKGLSSGYSDEDLKQLDSLKTLFNDFTGAISPMEKFQKTLDDARESAGSLTEEIIRLKEIQAGLNPADNSSSGYEKRSLVQQRLNEAEKERRYLLGDFLRSVAGSEERRLVIEKRYADLRADLDARTADKKAAGYLKALKRIDDAEKKELEEDKDEAAQKSEEYKAFVKVLEKQQDELKKIDIENAREDFKRFTENLDKESDEYKKHYQDLLRLEEAYQQKRRQLMNTAGDLAGQLGAVMSEMGGGFAEAGNLLSGMASQMSNLSTVLNSIGSDGKMSMQGWAAAIQSVISMISTLATASKNRKEAEKQYYSDLIQFETEYQLAINNRIGDDHSSNPFMSDQNGKIKAGVDQYQDALDKYQASIAKLEQGRAKVGQRDGLDGKTVGKMAGSGAVAGAAIGAIVGVGVASVVTGAIGAAIGGAVGAIAGLFAKKKKDVFGNLLDLYPELVDGAGNLNKELAQTLIATNQVDGETKVLLQSTIEWSDQVKEATDQIMQTVSDMTGQIANDLTDAMVNAFKAGEDGAKAMSKALGGIVENLVKQMVLVEIFRPIMEEFMQGVKESFGTGGDGSLIDNFAKLNKQLPEANALGEQIMKGFQDYGRAHGMPMFEPNDSGSGGANGLQGSIRGMSEETASVLVGQFNAVRIHQADMAGNIRISVSHLHTIANNTAFNRYLVDIKDSLAKIEKGNSLRSGGL